MIGTAAAGASRVHQIQRLLRRWRGRVRATAVPILQTAVAATLAWVMADLLLPQPNPSFAPIAAVICVGATFGQRRERAVELMTGVVVGIVLADLLSVVVGPGPLLIGMLVTLAMVAVLMFGEGLLLVSEAAISAIIIATLERTTDGFTPDRLYEGLIGGGVALLVSALLFPPNPTLIVGRAGQAVFQRLGSTVGEIALALETGDAERADRALAAARSIDQRVGVLDDALRTGWETARLAPARRAARHELEGWERTIGQLDLAVRNTRVLARDVLRLTRSGTPAPPQLAAAVRDLAAAVWELAATLDERGRADEVRRLARQAVNAATGLLAEQRDLETSEVIGQIRSLAADLLRAAEFHARSTRWSDEPVPREHDAAPTGAVEAR